MQRLELWNKLGYFSAMSLTLSVNRSVKYLIPEREHDHNLLIEKNLIPKRMSWV